MTRTAPFPKLRRGLVAILRGLQPDRAVAIARAIYDAGISAIEVPLNSPEPFASIAAIGEKLPGDALIGAGTVLTAADVDALARAGGRLLVSPNINAEVMGAAMRHGMVTMPGVMTPTEAFEALRLGASALKFFPASVLGANGIGAIRAVLPPDALIGAVGGVSHRDFAGYRACGVTLFGLGSSLFKPEMSVEEIARRAAEAVAAWDAAFGEAR
jgi:2-dehydro-3-deoxyphosphogalactonate aldolase